MRHHPNPFGRKDREAAGVTATLTDGHEVIVVVVQPLPPREALLAVCDTCDRLGLKVVTLSTPQTIHSDLLGRSVRAAASRSIGQYPAVPEPDMLAKVGRRDLLWTGRPE